MDVNQLTKIIDSPGASSEERQAARETLVDIAIDERLPEAERQKAVEALRRMQGQGSEGFAARGVLTEFDPQPRSEEKPDVTALMQQLMATTGVRFLGDVEYAQVHEFCTDLRTRNQGAEAQELHDLWAMNNPDARRTVLKVYLALHHESRAVAKHLLKNYNTGRWPNHWINRKTLEEFLQTMAQCEDVRLIVQEFLDKGTLEHWDKPPRTCDCWKLADAIERAARENNPRILVDYLNRESKAA